MTNSKKSPLFTGYIIAIIAAITYGMNPLFALPLYKIGMEPASVLFFRYLCALPMLGGILLAKGHNLNIGLKDLGKCAIFGLLFATSSQTLFMSYNHMDAGIASTILFVYPVMVALIMTIFFKEKLRTGTVLCLALALTGIGLLYKGKDGATLSLTGTALVMVASLSYAIYLTAVSKSHLENMPTMKVSFYVLLCGCPVFALIALSGGHGITVPPPDKAYMWLDILAIALFPTAISLHLTTKATQTIGSTPTAILGALEPVTAVVFGVTIFGEVLTFRDVCGLVLIIAAVSLVVAAGGREKASGDL